MTERISADLAVVGLGPAGVAATVRAVDAGARVVALDDGQSPGGQIWRHPAGATEALPSAARLWISRLLALPDSRCRILRRTAVVDAPAPGILTVVTADDDRLQIEAPATVLATGARERFLPFPGWTLPGVLGVGGAQALVKSGALVAGLRVVIAGSGPLLLPVAATWAKAGARVVCVAEQAPFVRVARFAAGLVAQPGKIVEALAYRASCAASPFRFGTWVREARAAKDCLVVTLGNGQGASDLACDVLACGFGLVPNLELARLLECRVDKGAVVVDHEQRTTTAGVFAAGEACGVGGADLALVEGEIAAMAAVGKSDAARALGARRRRLRAFARSLDTAFALRDELRALARPDTVVCRCEDVVLGRLRPEWTPRQAKLYTRVGMGPCQGRVCGTALETIFGWPPDTVRPPLYPVSMDALKEADA